jgi:hypothetical protein
MFRRSTPRWNPTHNLVSPEKPLKVSTIRRVALSRLRDALHRSKSILFWGHQSRGIAQNGPRAERDQFQQYRGN